jgi:hypothetical protein
LHDLLRVFVLHAATAQHAQEYIYNTLLLLLLLMMMMMMMYQELCTHCCLLSLTG